MTNPQPPPSRQSAGAGVPIFTRIIPVVPGMGRHVRHDPRSLAYGVRSLPKSVIQDVDWTRRVPIFDQLNLGACTGNALAGLVGTDNSARKGQSQLTYDPSQIKITVTAGTLSGRSSSVTVPNDEGLAISFYSAATYMDSYSGHYLPNDTGSDGVAVSKVAQSLGLCEKYIHGFSLNDLDTMLQSGPVMIGSVWYNSMFEPAASGVIPVDPSSGEAGGHEYVCSARESTKSGMVRYRIDNSWNSSWGINGSAYFEAADLAVLLKDDGDVTQPELLDLSVTPTPTPTPTPVPTNPNTYTVSFSDAVDARLVKNAPKYGSVENYIESIVKSRFKGLQNIIANLCGD